MWSRNNLDTLQAGDRNVLKCITTTTIIIIMSLVTGLFSWYFSSWNSADLPSSFKFKSSYTVCDVPRIVVFVVNLLNVFLVWLPNFSLNILLLFQQSQLLPVQSYISCSTFIVSLFINCLFEFLLCIRLHDISVCWYCHNYQYACFLVFVSNYYIWPICHNFSICVYLLIPQHCHIFMFT